MGRSRSVSRATFFCDGFPHLHQARGVPDARCLSRLPDPRAQRSRLLDQERDDGRAANGTGADDGALRSLRRGQVFAAHPANEGLTRREGQS